MTAMKPDPSNEQELTGFQGLGAAARPLSWLYSAFIRIRRTLFDLGIMRVRPAPVFTVSIGGLEVGGVGKTPVVVYLLRQLIRHGRRPGLLSRGYGREVTDLVLRLPGDPVDPAKHGDEPSMVVASGLDVPLGICADRSRAARVVASGTRSDVLVMDDGFAHRRMARHVDVVVLRAESPLGTGQLLPAGTLREPPSSLRRASLLWFHSKSGDFNEPEIERAMKFSGGAGQVRSVSDDFSASTVRFDHVDLANKKVIAVAGIARPADFLNSLKELGAEVCELKVFPDHHRYSRRDRVAIGEALIKSEADRVVTTAKDYVKLQPLWGSEDLVKLQYSIKLVSGYESLADHMSFDMDESISPAS